MKFIDTILMTIVLLYTFAIAESVDADYCLDLEGDTAKAVLVKSYTRLKPALLNIQDKKTFICLNGERIDTTVTFYFYDKQPFFGWMRYFDVIDGGDGDDTLLAPKHKISPIVQMYYPRSVSIYLGEGYHNKDLLQFKNKTVKASLEYYFICRPSLDTTIYTPFRARITGECEYDTSGKLTGSK